MKKDAVTTVVVHVCNVSVGLCIGMASAKSARRSRHQLQGKQACKLSLVNL